MILTVVAFLVPLVLIFTVDTDTYLITSVYLYGLLVCWRWLRRQNAFLDVLFLITLSVLAILQTGIGIQQFVPFTGSVIYFMLTVAFLWASLTKPWTIPPAEAWKPEALVEHRVSAFFLFLGNLAALVNSIVLFPSLSYIFVPLVLTGVSIPLSMFIRKRIVDLVASVPALLFARKEDRAACRQAFGNVQGMMWISEQFVAKEVTTDTDRELFFRVLEKGYYGLYQKSQDKAKGTYADFIEKLREEFRRYAHRADAFVVYDLKSNAPVGCIRLVARGDRAPLPMETFLPVSLGEMAKRVDSIAEVGRFAILSQGPAKARVLELLILLMIVKVLQRSIRVILTDAMESSIAVYEKMGMKVVSGPYIDEELAQNSYLCAADVAGLLIKDGASAWDRAKQLPMAQRTIRRYLAAVRVSNRRRVRWGRPVLEPGAPLEINVQGGTA